jgi:hypothetical protein
VKSKIACSAFAATVLLVLTQSATAQGTSGGTGAVASIPGSVVRAAEEGRPVKQPGLISILTNPPPPTPNVDSKQTTTLRGKGQVPSK